MEQQDLRTLQILEEIEKNQSPSQRELAKKLNISLGLVNSFVKRLAQKGYVKVTTIPKNRINYILTPKGFAEKTKLTYDYIKFSYHFYRDTRIRLRNLFQKFMDKDVRRVIFVGTGDLAEIAYLSLQETSIELVAVIDDQLAGKKLFDTIIHKPEYISDIAFDKILITKDTQREIVLEELINKGVSRDKIVNIP